MVFSVCFDGLSYFTNPHWMQEHVFRYYRRLAELFVLLWVTVYDLQQFTCWFTRVFSLHFREHRLLLG